MMSSQYSIGHNSWEETKSVGSKIKSLKKYFKLFNPESKMETLFFDTKKDKIFNFKVNIKEGKEKVEWWTEDISTGFGGWELEDAIKLVLSLKSSGMNNKKIISRLKVFGFVFVPAEIDEMWNHPKKFCKEWKDDKKNRDDKNV